MNKTIYEEALETIGELDLFEESVQFPHNPPLKEQFKQEYDILKKLVERDTPMKPINEGCPSCKVGRVMIYYDNYPDEELNFCADCGQRLDWSI